MIPTDSITCDRCGDPAPEPVVLHCLTHALRKASPRSRVELCRFCASALVSWLERPPSKAK
jgi:hypothetical protein